MNLELILGLSKTGKSKYIYDLIDEDIKKGVAPILFVPSQERVKTEENYIEYQRKCGLIGFNVTTVSSYVNENVEKYLNGIFDKYITKIDRKILLFQAIKECSDKIKLFKSILKKDGFLEILNIYMDIFRKSNVRLDQIENLNLNNKILEQKIREIALIYDIYLKKMNQRFIDDIGKIDIFIEEILGKNIDVYGKNIYFDGYNNFTESEYKFIEKLCMMGANIKITLNTDIEEISDIYTNNTSDIFEISNKTYLRILKICDNLDIEVKTKIMRKNYSPASGDLKYLVNNLFFSNKVLKKKDNCKSINVNITNNNYTEIYSVANNICNFVQKSGYRYDDFVIYTTNIDEYEHIIKKIFAEYSIPLYINKKYKITNSKLVSYILMYLEILKNGLNFENGINILKLNLNNIDNNDIYELENYIDEFNIKKYSILVKKFTLNTDTKIVYNIENINSTVEKIKELFYIHCTKDNMRANDIVRNIYDHLEKNGVFEKYRKCIYDNNFSSDEENLMSLNIEKQVWEKIREVFDSISKIFGDDKCTIDEFYQIFKSTIKDINIRSIPPTMDQVSVLDINVSKTPMKKIMFFIGVNEDKFPLKVEQDILFNDNELETLKDNNIDVKELSISKYNMQLFNIYMAISNVSDKLNILVPSSDISGKSRRISSIVNDIKKIINIKIIGNVASKKYNINDEYCKDRIFEYVIESLMNDKSIDNYNIKEVVLLYFYFLQDNKYKNILNYKKNYSNLNDSTIDAIYNNNFDMSISKLEQFRKCPFSYYVKYCLKIDKKNVFEIKTIDTGNFMHEVIEEFSIILCKNNISFSSILTEDDRIIDEYGIILDEIISSKIETKMNKYKDSIRYDILKQKLKNTMKRVIAVIAIGFKQSNFKPYGYEIEFKKNGDFLPIVIKLDKKRQMNLIGKIDRIDVMNLQDKKYVRVVDYKSSSRLLTLDDIRNGISLQLATYMASFIENKGKDGYIPAGLLYFNLSNKLINLREYTNDESKIQEECIKTLRMNGIFLNDIKVLENMDKKVNEKSGKLIDISTKNIDNSSKALEEKEFMDLCKKVKDILREIGEEVIKGVVEIRPEKKSDPCKYCDYSTICRKNINV